MNFIKYLNEKTQLDISILSVQKFLTSDKKKEYFLNTPCIVHAKSDGIKCTFFKFQDTGNFLDDFIIAYKGAIQYPEEYNFLSTVKVKKESIGNAQFKLLFMHFKKIKKTNIPIGTELLVEYLVNKPTLSSKYKKPHGLVLIGYTKSKYDKEQIRYGKLITTPSEFNTNNIKKYANELNINIPLFLFDGILSQFSKGIQNKELQNIFNQYKNIIDYNDKNNLIQNITEMFLQVQSAFGGTEEGVVLEFQDGRKLKIQQIYQVDQTARTKIKAQYQADTKEEEQEYWNNIHNIAYKIRDSIVIKSRKLPDLMKELSTVLKKYPINIEHPKKTAAQVLDDIQLVAKNKIIRDMKGNNGALLLGRFQPITLGHQRMINYALKMYDNLTICIVRARKDDPVKNPVPLDLQIQMFNDLYPEINIITHSTGNIPGMVKKAKNNINVILAGSDRVKSYREQLKTTDMTVTEIPRTSKDISASKVRQAIIDNDFNTYKKLMDKKLYKYYNILKKYIKEV